MDDIFLKKIEEARDNRKQLLRIKSAIEIERAKLKQYVSNIICEHSQEKDKQKKKELVKKRMGYTEALKDLEGKRVCIDTALSEAKEKEKERNIKKDKSRIYCAAFVKAAKSMLDPDVFAEIEKIAKKQLN